MEGERALVWYERAMTRVQQLKMAYRKTCLCFAIVSVEMRPKGFMHVETHRDICIDS